MVKLPGRYSSEAVVINHIDSVTSYNADGTGYRERTVVAHILSDAAVHQFGVIAVPFASASEKVEFLYVRVRRPDGTVTETSPAAAIEQARTRHA